MYGTATADVTEAGTFDIEHPSGAPLDVASLPEHQRRRRDRIVQAALELLQDGEYESIQVRDVAERADTSLGTLYRYFTSKEHLYAAALLEWASAFPSASPSAGRRSVSDEERLRSLMRRAIRAFERQPQMMRTEMIIENSNDPNARMLFQEFSTRHVATMNGALVDMTPKEAETVVETVNSVMAVRLRQWVHGRCALKDVERSVERTIDLIFSPHPG